MKMKRFTLVLGVLFMGGILATSMTSCDNATKDAGTEAVAPEADDDAADVAVETETVDSAEATDAAKCGEGKCGSSESTEKKAVDKDEVLKGEVEAPVTDKEKELSKNEPVQEVEKSIEGAKKESVKVESKELKCGGGK